jgi:hypothetical protein
MQEIIFKAPDADYLASEAARLGFADNEGHIITNGTFESGGGWFLNVVGTVYEPIVGPIDPEDPPTPVARSGYWGRLRLNGTPDNMPSFSSAIVQYVYQAGDIDNPGKWVDAATGDDAPEWVSTIGMIA